MDQSAFDTLASWVTRAGLIGRTESELMAGFCRRLFDAGVPLARAMVILDTLHPIYEGRVFRWRADLPDAVEAVDYGRTNEGEAAENWLRSPFFHLLQSGEKVLRRRFIAGDAADFPAIAQARDEGMTDYLALVHRFAAEGVIGEMDCVYSSWATDAGWVRRRRDHRAETARSVSSTSRSSRPHSRAWPGRSPKPISDATRAGR